MPREGEYSYFSNIGEEGRDHAVRKPFTDPECAETFADLSFIFQKLPKPPARVLECGCGTGWLSYFLARRGYRVTGQDVAEEALQLARANPVFLDSGEVDFLCGDFESLDLDNEFDAVVFYSSLHHAQDELSTIRSAYAALKPGGVFLSIEPGRGHEKRSRQVIAEYDLGDRDMPPALQVRRGREVGFSCFEVYVRPAHVHRVYYADAAPSGPMRLLWTVPGLKYLALGFLTLVYKRFSGAVLMRK